MARKTPKPSPRLWLGIFLTLALADFTFAKTTRLEELQKPVEGLANDDTNNDYNYDYDSISKKSSPSLKKSRISGEEESEIVDDEIKELNPNEETDNEEATISSTDLSSERLDASDDLVTTVRTEPEHSMIRKKDRAIVTTTTSERSEEILKNGKEASAIESSDVGSHALDARMTEGILNESQHDGGDKLSSIISHSQEFEAEEEQDDSERHTISELAEATTSSSKLFHTDRRDIFITSYSNIEHLDVEESDEKSTISLASDTAVNHRVDSENDTGNFRENSSGTTSSYEPKNQVEVFGDSGHPAVLRISEAVANDTDFYTTTPVYTISKPNGRTIAISGDSEVTTKRAKSIYQTTTDPGNRSFPKKSVSTEKPIVSKPYPYTKTDNRVTSDIEMVTEILNSTEQVTEEISAYENTIGRQKKTDDKIIVTEPSVLVENSIQQLKPIHDKRSGNYSRINSTFNDPVFPTDWSLITTENFGLRNASESGGEESRETLSVLGSTEQADNDVPRGNWFNISTSTERAPVILSEVTENNIETLIGRVNATGSRIPSSVSTSIKTTLVVNEKNSEPTEKIDAVSVTQMTSNQAGSDREESRTMSHRFNVTNEEPTESYSLPEESFFTSTEIYATSTSNGIEKINRELETTNVSLPMNVSSTTEFARESSSSEVPTTVFTRMKTTDEKFTNVTGLEINSDNTENSGSTTKPTTSNSIEQPTTVEYEFVGLAEGENSTVSQSYFASSEKANTIATSSTQTSATTETSEETTVTIVTDEGGITEQNETTLSRKVESTDPENSTSITTMSFEETTTIVNSNIIAEITTLQDQTNTTSSSVSEDNFTVRTTDIYPDTTTNSSTSGTSDNTPAARFDFTTSGQNNDSTTMIMVTVPITTEEATTISNIEVIVSSESTTTFQNPITITQPTTLQIETTTDAPEFPISTDEVTLFVRIIIEGSWTDVCPLLGNLRVALANMLTERTDKRVLARNIILYQTQCSTEMLTSNPKTPVLLYVVDDNGDFDYTMTEQLPNFYKQSQIVFSLPIYSVEKWIRDVNSPSNAIAVVAVSSVAFICLVILAGLLFIMRKRQTRFNYGERCRPVSLDSYRVDSVSAYNSVRRKDLARGSKRSYGNPAFEDSSVTPTHPLNFAGLSSFCNDLNAITEEFSGIPQVSARIDELPSGAEVKNRYANVVPLPETRVPLQKINNDPLTEYINASYVRGPKNATKYYIACQAPIESTVADFWRMIWEQQSKVIIMLTDIIENGVEKCVDYIPPSEVTDCHRLYGDYQVTLKKHEAKEKYAISTLHLKNLENSTYREVSHIWYLWPTNGVPSDATGLIAILLEARALQRGAPGPIVIHCSPGTGRTGTLIALDLGIRQYEITRTIDVPRVVYTIRRDRAGAVQTKEQYAFIYKALNLYAAKLAGGALESM